MIRPRAVVFDLGKVLLDFDYRIAARQLAPDCAVGPDRLLELFNHDSLLLRYEEGAINTKEFFAEWSRLAGYRKSLDVFAPIFGSIFSPIEPMIQLQQTLSTRGFATYIFSNTNRLAIEQIQKKFNFYGRFTGYILSFEQKALKPAPAIYEALERLSGFRGSELFYMDDIAENLAPAHARRWQTLLHETPEKTIAVLRERGLIK